MFTVDDIDDYVEDMGMQGWSIFRHPLYVAAPYMKSEVEIRHIVECINAKQKIIDTTNDLQTYIWMHERAFRLEAYLTCPSRLESQTSKELLISLWVDCESPHINRTYWLDLFNQYNWENSKKHLPEQVVIYRGGDYEKGLSWTTSYKIAEKFSMRGSQSGKIWSTVIDKKDIILYTDQRGEKEVVIDIT